ncbi:50S ribosomal protein L20 [Myxococcota bacterium]|nr:50S ribosomal protein L20 [Myxococcota bacterium]MBU1534736.1 50S ribosomal protein L20 [Myxococcota bacterium]
MPRVKGGFKTHRRHHRILRAARGYFLGRGKLWRTAVIQVRRAWASAFKGRKQRKRDIRRLWITRINAGAHISGMNYSNLIHGLKDKSIELNRKMLAELAANEPSVFAHIAKMVKG